MFHRPIEVRTQGSVIILQNAQFKKQDMAIIGQYALKARTGCSDTLPSGAKISANAQGTIILTGANGILVMTTPEALFLAYSEVDNLVTL